MSKRQARAREIAGDLSFGADVSRLFSSRLWAGRPREKRAACTLERAGTEIILQHNRGYIADILLRAVHTSAAGGHPLR